MKKILFDGLGHRGWTEGLYYLRNLIFLCLQNPKITGQYELTVLIDSRCAEIFECLRGRVAIAVCRRENKLQMGLYERKLIREQGVEHYVALDPDHFRSLFASCGISWIADLAHMNLPICFSEEEYARRDKRIRKLTEKPNTLLLGSEDERRDLEYFYTGYRCAVRVVPTVSYIEPELRDITRETEQSIAEKYGLGGRYVFVPGAFLPHRNHLVVLRAIERLRHRGKLPEHRFVFTGRLEECNDTDYRGQMEHILEEPVVRESVVLAGGMKRKEQLGIMKNAEFVVEPSLCEGWGMALEDAKVLDQTVLLSDISEHLEQRNEKCLLFDVHNPEALADLMEEAAGAHTPGDMERGIARMYREAAQYAEELGKVFT